MSFISKRATRTLETVNVLFVRQKAHVSAVVEENANCVIRQLVSEAVLVGIVHPLRHPLEAAVHAFFGNVINCRQEIKNALLKVKGITLT